METQNLTPALQRLRLRESPPPLLTSPHQNPNPNPNPNPRLRPSKSTAFKREERRRRKERKRQQRLQTLLDHPPPSLPPDPTVSDLPWPCDPTPSSPPTPTTAWPAAAAASAAAVAVPAPSAAAHAGALRASRAFFAEWNGEDDDSEEEEGEGDAIGGGAARGFFKGLFARDGELREYYEREWARGEFRCLVCEGVGARAGKRFGGCAALVQHAAAVAQTRARRAHRAFGSVVRRVLGWDDLQVDSCEDVASNEDEFAATAMET
ncbi:uncharacterized protein LOC109717208 [Ananas comosus]|uniref:Uncharacterized protein LOC109717208 n=1 Tax=Ananas comosus TaxID=4615 RepID=A0A6P5FYA0_ANACO|nr:uncharacterized protein LOC109717208 [Ananas comosus]